MDENMDIDQLNMSIDQLEDEILKRQDEIHDLRRKREYAKNQSLNQLVEKIVEKIVKDKLYQNEDLKEKYIYTTVDPKMVPEGVILENCDVDEDWYLDVTGIRDDESDVLSITFNIKYDRELRELMNQNWDALDSQSESIRYKKEKLHLLRCCTNKMQHLGGCFLLGGENNK